MVLSSVASSEELAMSDGGGEGKILVSIRLRPVRDKDLSHWECMDHNTLILTNSLPERSIYPCAYTFDRVFGCDSSTRKVYEEGAKEVALSVVNGINASIFAYGQTSSGKTYTMTGITTFAVADIYDYIEQQSDREFVMKFSAMEIYNEAVRDLLSSRNAPLRLLDDPERGTVVERLMEETLRDRNHLAELLYICEAQRKIGETSLNETSSRSHQILRLTIESSARDYFHTENSSTLAATVNFVDLAGSERASQTQSAGTRLKEGCHINRSLLTLGTVIRKLSKRRNGHVPYRDSKLTRILQHSLGGNARTAIICTINPARSHIEQSRNTLLFAGCAKQVSTNAQVNVLMSDKALVKQLQKEMARLEGHVRNLESASASGSFAALLREKELKIEKMEKEMKEVTQERDLAQKRVQELLRLIGVDKASRLDEYSESEESSEVIDPPYVDTGLRNGKASRNYHDHPSPRSSIDRYFQVPEMTNDSFPMDPISPKFSGPDPRRGWELVHQRIDEKSLNIRKDVECVEMANGPRMDIVIETDVTLASADRKEAEYVTEVSANEDEMSSSRKEDKELDHLRKDYSIDTLDENQDMNEDATSPRKEDNHITAESFHNNTVKQENLDMEGDATASPRKEDNHVCTKSFHDTVKQYDQDMYSDGETSPHKEDRDGEFDNHDSTCSFHDIAKREYQDMHMDRQTCPHKRNNEVMESNNLNIKCACEALQQKVQNMQKTINHVVSQNILEPTPCTKVDMSNHKNIKLARSRSCTEVLVTYSSSPLLAESDNEEFAPSSSHDMEFLLKNSKKMSKARSCVWREKFGRQDSMKSVLSACLPSEHTKMSEEDIKDVDDMYRGLREMTKSQSVSQFEDNAEVTDYEDANEDAEDEEDEFSEADKNLQPKDDWPQEFQRQRSKIIELWDACYVPLVHRTYFFLLFKGDPSDSIYMEVELRRLSFLKTSLNRTNPPKNSLTPTRASSIKALTREREMLSKQMHRKLDRSERESIYKKWGINLSTKQRSLQVISRIWTDTEEMGHIEESAGLVSRLVQLMEPGHQASKEMFGLSFSAGPALDRRSYSWRFLAIPFEV